MNIKVLWIDDDYKIQLDVIGDAEQDGIDLIPFESHEEGIEFLMKDLTGIHAVILDAKVKKNRCDTKTGLAGLAASRDRLIEINKQGFYLPYFIYTGQPDYMDKEWFEESYGEFYTKGIDNQRLFDDIKTAVLDKEEYIVQKEHESIFHICENRLDTESKETLTKILLGIKKNSFDEHLYFVQLRKILEKLFRKANEVGLLHDNCIQNGKVNLSESSLFLSGQETKHLNVKCSISHFSKIISEGVWDIISKCGAEVHTDDDKKPVSKNSPYLFYSLAYRLLDILIWFDNYFKTNSDFAMNKSYWENIQNEALPFIDHISKDAKENYYCGDYSLNKIYVEKNFNVGDKIKITKASENTDSKTKTFYSKYADRFEKI